MRSYARPKTLDEAIGLLAQAPRSVLAGGTDLYPTAGPQLNGDILDLTGIAALSGISHTGHLRIGACTTWTEVADANLPPALWALQQAARQVGGRQVQNMGTVGGNLCNASPAADGVPPLLVLDAEVELTGPMGTRRLPLAKFVTGPRHTTRAPDEVLTAVIVPETALRGRSAFQKLGARAYLVISIVSVAARVETVGDVIRSAALSVGACSGVAQRLPAVEACLIGAPVSSALARLQSADVMAELSPISDIRATAGFRLDAAAELVRRVLTRALP